jgi:hypothetical protein
MLKFSRSVLLVILFVFPLGDVGGTTQFWIRPEDGLVIAMISNLSDFDFGAILISLGEVFVSE